MNENILINQLQNNLPEGLSLERLSVSTVGSTEPDFQGILKIQNKEFPIAIEIKNTGGIAVFREKSRRVKEYSTQNKVIPFVVGEFFGEKTRQVAKEEGVGIIDLAGNFYFKKNSILIEKIVKKNPFAQKIPLKNLFASISSRITRVLLAQPKKSWRLNKLAQEAEVSLGQTHKITDRMIEEELVEWDKYNKLILKDPTRLLNAWKSAYPSYELKKFTFFSFEQNSATLIDSLMEKAGDSHFALSFFSGASFVAPFIRGVNKLQFYVSQQSDIEHWKNLLKLQEVKSGANIEIFIPYDKGVFYQTQKIATSSQNNIPVVSNIQLYMDLFNNPARGAEQAEHLRELKFNF